jgi:cephalosporin-C deacetylase-like acetyl esterase
MRLIIPVATIGLLLFGGPATAVEANLERGSVNCQPSPDESHIAERFRLATHSFDYQLRPMDVPTEHFQVFELTYPSPVQTPHEKNNTVYCEYFRPKGDGAGDEKMPAVIVLHILGGDFPLARMFCNALAQKGVAALFLKMPYYGPRRDPAVARRMVSPDPKQTVEGMTQAVLDIRRAVDWLSSRDEIDAKRLGIFGISLGGITGALAATAEPRLNNVCLLLAGGDLGRVAWDSPELSKIRKQWLNGSGTREEFVAALNEVDPVRYATSVRGRRILMMNAKDDEVIPKVCTESLWESFGKPPIHWFSGGHYSCIWHLPEALFKVQGFFTAEAAMGP